MLRRACAAKIVVHQTANHGTVMSFATGLADGALKPKSHGQKAPHSEDHWSSMTLLYPAKTAVPLHGPEYPGDGAQEES